MVDILICNSSLKVSEELHHKALECYSDRIKAAIIFEDNDTLFFYLEEHNPEPSILIIELEFCKNGIEVAERAKKINPWLVIIFISNDDKWKMEVYDIEHVYGLEYPLTIEKLKIAITLALNKIDEKRNTLFPIKKKGIVFAIPVKEIQYLEQDRRMIYIHTEEEVYSLYVKFSEIEKYKTDYFTRCHNSYAVNLFYVNLMSDLFFIMKCGRKIPISRSRKNEAKAAYEAFLSRKPV